MKLKLFLIPSLFICTLFFVACNNPGIIKPNTSRVNGSFIRAEITNDSIIADYHDYGTSYNPPYGQNNFDNNYTSPFPFNDIFHNGDSSASIVNNDTLKFKFSYTKSGCYQCYGGSMVFVKFNNTEDIIDYIYFNAYSNNEPTPPHNYYSAYTYSSKSLSLTKVPYTIATNGNIIVDLTGQQITNCSPELNSENKSYESNFDALGPYTNSNISNFISINRITEYSKIKIVLVKAK